MTTFEPSGLTVYVDGRYVPGNEAVVSIFDHGLLYGDGVFEGLRLFDGALFRPRDHFARLARSARSILLDLPLSSDELLHIVSETVRRCRLRDAHVRVIVTRGFGAPGIDPKRSERPTVIVAAYPFPPHLGTQPLRLMISAIVRKAPRSLGAHVKSLNYLDAIVAYQQAKACGMDEAVMLDSIGAVAECSSTNIFAVIDDVLLTPTTRAALPGVTRRTILELAAELGIPSQERDIWPMELYAASAAFVTGSGAGVQPVAEVDGHPLLSEQHPIVRLLMTSYRERTRDSRFTVPVYEEPLGAGTKSTKGNAAPKVEGVNR